MGLLIHGQPKPEARTTMRGPGDTRYRFFPPPPRRKARAGGVGREGFAESRGFFGWKVWDLVERVVRWLSGWMCREMEAVAWMDGSKIVTE